MYNILAKLLFKTNHVHYLPSCHSTNEVAQNLLMSGAEEGTIIITDDQFAGKGQSGNSWNSEKGQNLTFSLVLNPKFLKPNQQFLLTIAISLGIQEALEDYLPGEVKIKWPNDIYFKNKKIAGLLIENVLRGNEFESCIVGIGINVNQQVFEKGLRATSLQMSTGKEYDLNLTFNSVVESIASFYRRLEAGDILKLKSLFYNSLLGLGEKRRFKVGDKEFEGEIEGVDAYGRLLINQGNETLSYQHKEVKMLF